MPHRQLQQGRRAVRVDQVESPATPRQGPQSRRLMNSGIRSDTKSCSPCMAKVEASASLGCWKKWGWLTGCAPSISLPSRMIMTFLQSTPRALFQRPKMARRPWWSRIAILEYLLARYGPSPLAITPEDPAFADYLQFLHLGEAGLAGPMNAVFVGRTLAPESERNVRVTGWALETFESRLGLIIRRLANHPFFATDQFTTADISVSYALLLGLRTGNYTPGSVERAYLTRTTTRTAYARAMEGCQATKAWAARSPTL